MTARAASPRSTWPPSSLGCSLLLDATTVSDVVPSTLSEPLAAIVKALPRALQRCMSTDGWSLVSITDHGTLVWQRGPRPNGWDETAPWAVRKAVRAYGLAVHTQGGTRLIMARATPWSVGRPIDRARLDGMSLFGVGGTLVSAALVVDGRLRMPTVKRVDTRWNQRLLVEPIDIVRCTNALALRSWLRHAFLEVGINPYPELDNLEIDGVAGPYELAYPVLISIALSAGLTALAAVLRAAHRKIKVWNQEKTTVLRQETAQLAARLALARR